MTQALNGQTLAYIGDAVMSLQVRQYLVEKHITHPRKLLNESIKFVSAPSQALFVDYLLTNDELNELEMGIYRRGRNHKSQSIAKNADVIAYRKSTGLEALWGYLYLNQENERLGYFWELFRNFVEGKYETIHLREE